MQWRTEIVEGYARDLTELLERVTSEGWTVRFMLPNGVNRWTVVSSREAICDVDRKNRVDG